MQCLDVNQDGNIDITIIGNDYGMETGQGRADAFNGLVLINNGKKEFNPLSFEQSGFFVPGDARALSTVEINHQPYLVSTENRKPLSLFAYTNATSKTDVLKNEEAYAIIELSNHKKQKIEFSWGSTFLSQSSRKWIMPSHSSIKIYNQKGSLTRTIQP
jgi:hypothetical protein